MLVIVCSVFSSNIEKWFPFPQLTKNYSIGNLASLSSMNYRLFGTNVCYAKNFPLKDEAEGTAKRLAQLGINIVRFHHMDSKDIWNEDKTKISEEKLDRLHYFIYCLKNNGIYSNINLHVSREYPGLPTALKYQFTYGKALDQFYEPFIQFQEQYARDLLGSFNPYTNCTLAKDPAVAFVELNNENTMYDIISYNDTLMSDSTFKEALITKWKEFLNNHYTYEQIDKKVNPEKIDKSRDYIEESEMSTYCTGNCALTTEDDFKKFEITSKTEKTYGCRFDFGESVFEPETIYTLSFKARADAARSISSGIMKVGGKSLADWKVAKLTTDTQTFSLAFTTYSDADFSSASKWSIDIGSNVGTVWISDIALYKGKEVIQFSSDETLDSVWLPSTSSSQLLQGIYRLFITDCESNTEKRLLKLVKEELECESLVTSSQVSYGSILTFHREDTLSDFLDIHSYWQHPTFEPKGIWNYSSSKVGAQAMVDSPGMGTFSDLAQFRSIKRPATVSEYCHTFPNEHVHEMFLMFSSWAAHNDYDAIYEFAFNQRVNGEAEKNYISDFFSFSENPLHCVLAPFAAIAFREYGISTAPAKIEVTIPYNKLLALNDIKEMHYWNGQSLSYVVTQYCPLPQVVKFTDVGDEYSLNDTQCLGLNQSNTLPWRFGDITWDGKSKDETEIEDGIYIANGTTVKTATGHIDQNEINFGSIRINVSLIGKNTSSVAIGALDGKEIEQSERLLIAVVGRTMNTGQVYNAERTSTGSKYGGNWGSAPVLAEMIPFSISIDGGMNQNVIRLDEDGNENGTVNYMKTETGIKFTNDENKPTLWYLMTREMVTESPTTDIDNDDDGNTEENDDNTTVIAVSVTVAVVVVIAAVVVGLILWKRKKGAGEDPENIKI